MRWINKLNFKTNIMYKLENKSELPHQQRVIDEANELGIKIIALDNFIDFNPFFSKINLHERIRMGEQSFVMKQYFEILKERVNNF